MSFVIVYVHWEHGSGIIAGFLSAVDIAFFVLELAGVWLLGRHLGYGLDMMS